MSNLKRPRSPSSSDDAGAVAVVSDSDGVRVLFSEVAAKQCEMLLVAFEMEMESASFHAPVASTILRLASNLLNSKRDEIDAALEAATSEAEQVFALCHASIFLGAELLQRAACKRVAAMIEPLQTPARIRAALGIAADLSAEEERAALAEPLFATAAPLADPTAPPSGLPSSVSAPPSAVETSAEATSAAETSSAGGAPVGSFAAPGFSRSLSLQLAGGSATASAEDVISAVLAFATPATLWRLKGVSRAWQERARTALVSHSWLEEQANSADALEGLGLDLGFALQREATASQGQRAGERAGERDSADEDEDMQRAIAASLGADAGTPADDTERWDFVADLAMTVPDVCRVTAGGLIVNVENLSERPLLNEQVHASHPLHAIPSYIPFAALSR